MPQPSKPIPVQRATPRTPIAWSERASRDRLSSTLFLAGLFHAVILLGVTFGGDLLEPSDMRTSLDVVLVTKDYEEREAPEDAQLLAQQNLVGAGNTARDHQLRTALPKQLEAGNFGPEQLGVRAPQREGAQIPSQRPTVLAVTDQGDTAIPEKSGETEDQAQQEQRTLFGNAQTIEIVNEPDPQTLISDANPRELMISANTREARIAAYLNGWKNKVERIGTLNYPSIARSAATASFPTLEVAIRADGGLDEVILRRSSGQNGLDQAAINILRDAAPFDPFPDFLRDEYEVLRFAYEWRFTNGVVTSKINVTDGG